MARKCTCQICKSKGMTDVFYKITDDKGKNKYYCSKEEYDAFVLKKEKRYNLLKYIAEEILQLEEGQIVSPSMVKRIEKLNTFYDYEVIHECFRMNEETIHYWKSVKNFGSEYGMVSYIMTIIEGNINDVYAKWKHNQRVKQKQESKSNNADLEILNEIESHEIKENDNGGIMAFLDEEDI